MGSEEIIATIRQEGEYREGGGREFITVGDTRGRYSQFDWIVNERIGCAVYRGNVGGQEHVELRGVQRWDWIGRFGEQSNVAVVGCVGRAGEYECVE